MNLAEFEENGEELCPETSDASEEIVCDTSVRVCLALS